MVNIQPVVFPIVGTATKLSVTVLGFATNAKTCGTYYALLTEDNVKLIEGNYHLTEAEFTAWGVDNSYIDDIIASHLNVVIVPESMDDDAVDNGGGDVQSVTLGAPNLD